MKLSKAVKPISYLKAHTSEVIRELSENRQSVIITQNGQAKAVLQDIHAYEKTQESLALLKMLLHSQEHRKQGKFKLLSQTFKEVRRKIQEDNS